MTEANDAASGSINSKNQGLFARLRKSFMRGWQGLLPSNSYKRLESMLPVSHNGLEALSLVTTTPARLQEAKKMLQEAQEALETEGDPERGWQLFKASRRLELYAVAPDERLARARSILREASDDEKSLSSWRKTTIMELLADGQGKLDVNITPDRVVQAAKILDEHHDNVYQKLIIIQARLKVLAILTVFALAYWIVAPPPIANLATIAPRIFWCTIFLSGIIGAIISGFTSSIKKEGKRARIPLELSDSSITFARLALGALSALAVTIFLISGLLKLGELRYELMLTIAIVSGFSERLLLRAIEAVSKPEQK